MKIALVCDYSLDYLGGAQTAFLQQAQILAEAGHEVAIIAPRTRMRLPDGVRDATVPSRLTIPVVRLPLLRNTARLRGQIESSVRDADIVHTHSEFGLSAAATSLAHAHETPVVHTVHTFYWRTGLRGVAQRPVAGILRRFTRWLTGRIRPAQNGRTAADDTLRDATLAACQDATVTVSPSQHQRDDLVAAGAGRVEVVVNSLSTSTPSAPMTTEPASLRVAWVGRLAPEKRVLTFVTAVVEGLKELEPGRLSVVIVGDGPQTAAARRLARGNDSITFTGRLPHAEVQQVIAESGIVALTSSGFDNQPMTVVEALAAARGVLYVDAALRHELADAGLLCRSDDATAIAAELVALAHEPRRIVELSARAHAAFDQFSAQRFAAAMGDVYRAASAGAVD